MGHLESGSTIVNFKARTIGNGEPMGKQLHVFVECANRESDLQVIKLVEPCECSKIFDQHVAKLECFLVGFRKKIEKQDNYYGCLAIAIVEW